MQPDKLEQIRSQLMEQKEQQLVQLGATIGKIELIDQLIAEAQHTGAGAPSPAPENETSPYQFAQALGAQSAELVEGNG